MKIQLEKLKINKSCLPSPTLPTSFALIPHPFPRKHKLLLLSKITLTSMRRTDTTTSLQWIMIQYGENYDGECDEYEDGN